MEFHLVLLLPLLLLLLIFSFSAAGEVNTIHPSCPSECGGVAVPYPFGIGVNCSMPGFELECKKNIDGVDKPFTGVNIEFINITLTTGQARVYNPVSSACYIVSSGIINSTDWSVDFRHGPYRYSNSLNKFTAVGCKTLAYVVGEVFVSGCVSQCPTKESIAGDSSCSGMGCCQTPITDGLNFYQVSFDGEYNSSNISDFSRCGYGFLVDNEWFRFKSSYVTTDELQKWHEGWVPVVMDWAIGNVTCEAAQANATSYACRSEHSDCVNSTNGPGYRCNCLSGYEGNPYLVGGCADIDECGRPQEYCNGTCYNYEGSFSCVYEPSHCVNSTNGPGYLCNCSSGYEGNPYLVGGCTDINECEHPQQYPCNGACFNLEGSFSCKKESKKMKLWIGLLIGLLSTFVLATFANHMYERVKLMRVKRKCFQQNGGLLLQEQINTHQGVKFKIFTIKEIEKATDNFDVSRVIGEGGHGLVYRGSLADHREVAIKRSRIADQKKKEEFAKEMYIGSLINHRNVVNILGCCLEVEVPLLVYEFVPKGDLFNYIHVKQDPIPLDLRLKVVGESAAALAYLHSDASPSILHGDVKSANILLDESYAPKVSDFGASILDNDQMSTHAQGTWGYIDPEYVQTCLLTDKSDVYSFAVVLLEVFTRKPVVLSDQPGAKPGLVSLFFSSVRENRFRELLDSEIRQELGNEQVEEIAEILTRCLSPRGEYRPTMKEVAAWIERLRICIRPSTAMPWSAHDSRVYEGNDHLNSGESSSFWKADGTNYMNTGSRVGFNIHSGR